MSPFVAYHAVPQLWTDTVQTHRTAVRNAVIAAAAHMVEQRGLAGVTMSGVAEQAGIGRATLYKYFPDLQAVLTAWHEHVLADHLHELATVGGHAGTPVQRLVAVLQRFGDLTHQRHDGDLAALLHRGEHVDKAQQHLRAMVGELIAQGAQAGELRDDIAPDELARFCLHALTAAGGLPSHAAVRRLVTVTVDALKP